MLEKNVIRIADLRIPGVISGFARAKKGGKSRPIISVKFTNSFIEYQKFRMTTTKLVTRWVRHRYLFTLIDCSDAYFAIPLEEEEVKYTRFRWRETILEFLCIMFWLGQCAGTSVKLHCSVFIIQCAVFHIECVMCMCSV